MRAVTRSHTGLVEDSVSCSFPGQVEQVNIYAIATAVPWRRRTTDHRKTYCYVHVKNSSEFKPVCVIYDRLVCRGRENEQAIAVKL